MTYTLDCFPIILLLPRQLRRKQFIQRIGGRLSVRLWRNLLARRGVLASG
jgi:hypothetical protein